MDGVYFLVALVISSAYSDRRFHCFLLTALVAEIKEIKEKTQKADDVVLAIAAGSRHPISPHQEFAYSDTDLHEDLQKLIKYSCEEVCTTKEQLNKVMRLWTTFLEPMLGISTWLRSSVLNEDVGTGRHHARGSTNSNSGEGNGSPGPGLLTSKQLKPLCNGDGNKLPEQANSSKVSLGNGDTAAKDDSFHSEKERKILATVDTVPGFSTAVGSREQLANANANANALLANVADTIHGRIMELTSGLCIMNMVIL